MKSLLNLSITAKLLLVNILIFVLVGSIIFVVYFSFNRIQESFTTIIADEVNKVIQNAHIGRELNVVFLSTNSLIMTINEDPERFAKESHTLTDTVNTLIEENEEEQLQTSLQDFLRKLLIVFDHTNKIHTTSQKLQELDHELGALLNKIEEAIAEELIIMVMEERKTRGVNQISSLIPGFRESLLQIMVQVNKMRLAHAVAHNAEEAVKIKPAEEIHATLFLLLDDLISRLRTLPDSEEGIAGYGQQLISGTKTYRVTITEFHHVLREFAKQVFQVREAQKQVISIMGAIDSQIAKTTDHIRENVSERIGQSKNIIFVLSIVVVIVLSFGLLVTRWMITPLVALSVSATQLADGNIECDVQDVAYLDEIGMLSRAFKRLILYFKEMAYTATEISHGNLDLEIRPRSGKDVFGNQFQQMVTYLKGIGEIATQVSEGDLRSRVRLQAQNDQIGNAFIQMQKGLIALISGIRSAVDYISSISTQTLSTSAKSSEALKQIGTAAKVTSSAMQEVNASAEEARINIERLSTSVEETTTSISQTITSIKHVAENSRKLSGFAEDTSKTVSTIVDSLEKVAVQAEHSKNLSEATTMDTVAGQRFVEQMVTRMSAISNVTDNIFTIILRLESRSKEIGTILDVINEVADQTSLLALNASIIAAQAGSHGRGFAVVAEEIKELATRVGTSTKKISEIVKAVQRDSSDAANAIEQGQQEVDYGVQVAQEAGAALNKISQSVGNSSGVAAEIAVLVRQQTTASIHIAESVRGVTSMITEITGATEEQERNSSQLFTIVENMQTLAAQVLRATQEQQHSTRHVTELMDDVTTLVGQSTPTVKQLAQSADELASQADLLKKEVERFIIPKRSSAS